MRYTSKVTADNSLEYTTAKLSTTLLNMTSSSLAFKKESSLVLRGYKYTSSVHFQAGGGGILREHLTYHELSLWGEYDLAPPHWYDSVVSQSK